MAKGRVGVRIPENVKKQRQVSFLEAYVVSGAVLGAARLTGEADTTHYEWMKDPDYAAAFVDAEKRAIAHLEAELFNRVYQGTDEPVIYQGELCYQKDKAGRKTDKPLTIKRKSDTLLIFALKGKKPEVYRDTLNSNVNVTANVQTNVRIDMSKVPEQDLNYVLATLEAARIQQPGGDIRGSLPGESETPEKET